MFLGAFALFLNCRKEKKHWFFLWGRGGGRGAGGWAWVRGGGLGGQGLGPRGGLGG